jgi:hypothetical protein
MGLNQGYLKAARTEESNEQYTPFYAVDPITKYIPKTLKVWCPFDCEWSAFFQTFKRGGWQVERSSLEEGQNFFEFEPTEYDVIISNPPFTQKDAVLKRLYELGKPFAILLPLNSLQGVSRYKYFKQGIQILTFDKRIGFHNPENMKEYKKGSSFATAYFCKDVLPKDLIVEELKEYQKSLKEEEK